MKSLFNVLSRSSVCKLDICLQQDSAVYKSFRIKGSIGPMRVQLVAEGTFRELRKQMMAFSNTSPNTFKMHRVLHRKEYAHFLLGKTISWNLLSRGVFVTLTKMFACFHWLFINELMNCVSDFWLLKLFNSLVYFYNHIYNSIKTQVLLLLLLPCSLF